MDEERREHDPERERRAPVLPAQPLECPPSAQQRGRRCSTDKQEPDESRLRKELQRQAVRLAHVDRRVAELPVHELERPGSDAAQRLSLEPIPCLLPPAPAVVQTRLGEPARALRDLLVSPERVPADGERRHQAGDQQHDSGRRPPTFRISRSRSGPGPVADVPGRRQREAGAEQEEEREPSPVLDANRPRLPVLRDPRQLEGNHEHEPRRNPRRDQRNEPLEPLAREREPDRKRDERRQDPPARVREHERHEQPVQSGNRTGAHDAAVPRRRPERERQPEHRDERQRVPVPDRRAKPSEPPVVLVERGHGLPRETPRQHVAVTSPPTSHATSRGATTAPTKAPTTPNAR